MAGEPPGGLRYVGFGFGPIQTGLMLLEAMDSGAFSTYTIVEIDAALVASVRAAGSRVVVNIAGRTGVRRRVLQGFTILNPQDPADRLLIGEAIRGADEMATAIPSVAHYARGGEASIPVLLARHIDPGKPRVLYASENHNYAGELLRREILRHATPDRIATLEILDTVIGKMSGLVKGRDEMDALGLEPLTPGWTSAVLVEEFNRILVSRPAHVRRGIGVFQEKDDLLPFEEAKLYGHNAIHSLLGYLAAWKGYEVMTRIRDDPGLMDVGLGAFREESGVPLIRRHARTGDPLFTPLGWESYARDLLERMTSPWLNDRVDRICRDPARKLGATDRLIGAMTLALHAGVVPSRLALGAAAAIRYARAAGESFAQHAPDRALPMLWGNEKPPSDLCDRVIDLVMRADEGLTQEGGAP